MIGCCIASPPPLWGTSPQLREDFLAAGYAGVDVRYLVRTSSALGVMRCDYKVLHAPDSNRVKVGPPPRRYWRLLISHAGSVRLRW